MKRLRLTPLLALLFAPLAHADLFHSEHVPGHCLGHNGSNEAVLAPCGTATMLLFGGYGPIRMGGLCLGTAASGPRGNALRWETCNQPPERSSFACRFAQDQCWGLDKSTGKLGNEQGWAADIEHESRNSGARILAWDKKQGASNQNWTFRNLIKVDQAAGAMGLNAVGKLQLRNLDSYATSRPGDAQIISFNGSYMVAAGGGNMVAAGGGNMVAAGGGNIVAAGGGNMVAAGGGNLIDLRGSTLRALGGTDAYMGTLARLVGNDGASLVGNDGASLIGNDGSTLTSRLAGYFSKQPNISFAAEAAKMVAAGGGNLLGGTGALSQQAIMALATSALTMSNSISGRYGLQSADLPANLTADKAEMLTRLKPQLERLAAKVKQMRADGQTIPPNAINGAIALRNRLQEALVASPPLPVNIEPQLVSTLNAIERLLNQPVAAAPVAPPPPMAPPPPPKAPPPAPSPITPPAPLAPPPAPPMAQVPPPPLAPPAQPAPQAPPAAAPQPALAAGPCADPWVNDTVAKTLNRPARGSGKNLGECNIARYGNGSWGDYQDLLRKTQAAYAACSDKWVSAAVWEVLGRAPQGSGTAVGDCNHSRYANGRWNNYDELVAAVRQAPAAPVAAPPAMARTVTLRSTHAPGKCMAPAAGGGFILWDCVDNPNQRFAQETDGSLKQNGQCLGSSGNALRLESCHAQALHQKWLVEGGALRNSNMPPYCIEVDSGSKNNGARLQAQTCSGASTQKWSLQP